MHATEPDPTPRGRRPGEPQIVVTHLTMTYGQVKALRGVSLTAHRGEIVVIIGGSGAGKTTLLKLLIGLEQPTTGVITIDGIDLTKLGELERNRARQKLGMVFQYAALLDSMNTFDNVAFPLREHTKLSEKEIRVQVREKLELLGLAGTEARFPSELSGGMRKRVGLARALMMQPSALLYDEPTSGLDPITSRQVDRLIVDTRDRLGVTSLVISHDMASALAIADYIYLLSQGVIAGEGTPAELRGGSNALATEFLRSSGIA